MTSLRMRWISSPTCWVRLLIVFRIQKPGLANHAESLLLNPVFSLGRALDLLLAVELHVVANLDVLQALNDQAALVARLHLPDIVLEALEAADPAIVDPHAAAQHAHAVLA